MNSNTQIGKSGEDDTLVVSVSKPQGDSTYLDTQLSLIEFRRQAEDVSKSFERLRSDFEKLESRLDKVSTFMMWIMGIMAGVFFVNGVLVAFDYYVNNEVRYEKFIDETQEIRMNVYSKEEVNSIIKGFKD